MARGPVIERIGPELGSSLANDAWPPQVHELTQYRGNVYQVSWSAHLDVAEIVERLLTDASVTGVVGVGQSPGITGMDLAEGFARHLGRSVSFHGLSPEAFGDMIAPLFGADAAAGVVAGYQAQAQASANAIAAETSAQRLLGLTPRTLQQWLAEMSV